MKSRYNFLSLYVIIVVGMLVTLQPRPVEAYPTPTAPAASHYISPAWGEVVIFNGSSKLRAYQYGYNAFEGNPYTYITLAFGRQQFLAGSGWGVNLVGSDADGFGYKKNSWVKSVAQAFIDGFNNGHPSNSLASVIIGTSNGTYPWTCDNNNASTLDPSWYTSGTQWGSLVNSVTWRTRAYAYAGNDIESWYDPNIFGTWSACGLGTIKWFEGYKTQSGRYVYNYGSNAYVEYPGQWTQEQLFQVSYGISVAYAIPQIYCNNYANQWVALRNYKYMGFSGVTSDNAVGYLCNNGADRTFTWQASWDTFNNALVAAGYSDTVGPAVTSFYYPR